MRPQIALIALVCLSGCPVAEPGITLYAFADPSVTEEQTILLAVDVVSFVPTKIVLYDNDVQVAELTGRPYHYTWNVTAADDGSHSFSAHAFYDVNGTRAATPFVSNALVFDVNIEDPWGGAQAPYPKSDLITSFTFGPLLGQNGNGGDNWPTTWGADGNLYTAYGDGWGFDPAVSTKLSMGFTKVFGTPDNFSGENIYPTNIDQPNSDGRTARKASGILMVDDVLYVWARNANPPGLPQGHGCQLLYSTDPERKQWTLGFVYPEFGYCGFINFGKNYEGARDGYVYMATPNDSDAYGASDEMVLTRVAANHGSIIDRSQYEFYSGTNAQQAWSSDISDRTPVFRNPGRCSRHQVSYNPALKRYIWWQLADVGFNPERDPRYEDGRFGVYEAPEPWGPWKTAFYTENWDHPSGEMGGFPTKWMSSDGLSMNLVYSAWDTFAVRKATMTLATNPTGNEDAIYPTDGWVRDTPANQGMDVSKLQQARDFSLRGGGSGMVTRRGRLVFEWGDQSATYDLKSTTKSFGATAIGVAVQDGVFDINDRVQDYDSRMATDKPGVTFLHLLTHTGGFYKGGGAIPNGNAPGTVWEYSDGGANRLAEAITLIYQTEIPTMMFQRLFTPMGLTSSDLYWRHPNWHRDDYLSGFKSYEFGAGVHSNVNSMARLGYLYLREGQWEGTQLIPKDFVQRASHPEASIAGLPVQGGWFAGASSHYGLLWWNNGDGTLPNVPRDAFWSWGLYDSYILVIPSLEIVAARAGASWEDPPNFTYDNLRPFFEPIAASVIQ